MTDLITWNDKGYLAFNPNGKPIEELPTIWGFNNGGQPNFLMACLLSDDGEPLGSHCCSAEGFMVGDLGVTDAWRRDRHEDAFKPHYPDGYKMDFVGEREALTHAGLLAAVAAHKARYPKDKADG